MVEVAVLGFGVVGSGVCELITGRADGQTKPADALLSLRYILELRAVEGDFAPFAVQDFSVIEQDPAVQIVVETIGGCGVALDFTERALRAGKSVVTSNKEVVAQHGARLMALAREHGAIYLFEASVGGGIPILRPLNQCLAANEISEICGILNGTTNYMFTRMNEAGLSFEEALSEAKEKGYAEQDPTADVEGHDSCRKIAILSSIAFGFHVLPASVPTRGMVSVQPEDVQAAAAIGRKIKLIGRSFRTEDGKVCAFVEPQLVLRDHPLSGVEDVFNAIMVQGSATGDVMFYGKGAGKLPTASAVVADLIAIARQMERSAYRIWEAPRPADTVSDEGLVSRFLLRVEGEYSGPAEKILVGDSCAYLTEPMTRPALEARLAGRTVHSLLRLLA